MTAPAIEGAAIANGIAHPEHSHELPSLIITANEGWSAHMLRELWEYRELLYFLVWRDVKVRYKQTLLGAGWAIIQPLMTVMIFYVVFDVVAKAGPADSKVPYIVFAFTGMLPWSYFSGAASRGVASVVGNSSMISKVYFPRLIVPIAATLAPIVDFLITFALLIVLMAIYGVMPGWGILLLPVFMLVAFLTALAVSLWLTTLNVRFRDIGQTFPFLIQIWLYATPIAYAFSKVPGKWRAILSVNPMVGVVEGFRWALLGQGAPDFMAMGISTAAVIVILIGGLIYFRKTERTFADVI